MLTGPVARSPSQWPRFCACLTGPWKRAAGCPLLPQRLTAALPSHSPVNLWKIYKAVEKLGAYEMVRKAPKPSTMPYLPKCACSTQGNLGKSVNPTSCPWPDKNRRRG